MTQSMIRRTLKNLVQNFSEAEVKVRETFNITMFAPAEINLVSCSQWICFKFLCSVYTLHQVYHVHSWRVGARVQLVYLTEVTSLVFRWERRPLMTPGVHPALRWRTFQTWPTTWWHATKFWECCGSAWTMTKTGGMFTRWGERICGVNKILKWSQFSFSRPLKQRVSYISRLVSLSFFPSKTLKDLNAWFCWLSILLQYVK